MDNAILNESGRAQPVRRVLAKFVDLFIVMTVSAVVYYPIGPIVGFLYSLFADALPIKGFDGQSL